MKKLFITLILSVFLISISSAVTLYVNTTNGVDTGANAIDAPWKTLKYTIANSAVGDTILVADGTYYEEEFGGVAQGLYINGKHNLTIIAENPWKAIISINETTGGDGTGEPMIYINSQNVTLKDLWLNGKGQEGVNNSIGVVLYLANYTRLINLKFTNITSRGIDAYSNKKKYTLIQNCTFDMNGTAIYMVNAMDDHMNIINNTFFVGSGKTADTIRLEYDGVGGIGNNLTLSDNKFYGTNNSYNYTGRVIYIESTATTQADGFQGMIIQNNIFGETAKRLFGKIVFVIGTNVSMLDNNFVNVSGDNVITLRSNSSNSVIKGNTFGTNTHRLNQTVSHGIVVDGSSNVKILNNKMYFAQGFSAISFESDEFNSYYNEIKNNEIYTDTTNFSYGIKFGSEQTDTTRVFHSIMENNTVNVSLTADEVNMHGIMLGYTINSTMVRNKVFESFYGAVVKGNDNCTVEYNTFINSSQGQILDKGSHNCVYRHNLFNGTVVGGDVIESYYNDVDERYTRNSYWWNNTISTKATVPFVYISRRVVGFIFENNTYDTDRGISVSNASGIYLRGNNGNNLSLNFSGFGSINITTANYLTVVGFSAENSVVDINPIFPTTFTLHQNETGKLYANITGPSKIYGNQTLNGIKTAVAENGGILRYTITTGEIYILTLTLVEPIIATGLDNISIAVLKAVIVLLAISALVFTLAIFGIYLKNNFQEIETMKVVEIAVFVLIFVLLTIVAINHIVDSL